MRRNESDVVKSLPSVNMLLYTALLEEEMTLLPLQTLQSKTLRHKTRRNYTKTFWHTFFFGILTVQILLKNPSLS